MKRNLFNRIGSIVLALIMVITLISPITAHAKTSTPTMDEIGYENTVFANGTAITIEAGTNGTTSIWYMNGSTKTYLAQNKDLSGYTIYGGFSGYNTYNDDTSTSITMTGGTVANIFLAGRNVKMYGETNFNMSGGTVSGWVYGGGSGYAYLHNGKNYNADVNISMTGGYVANMCGGNEENGGAYYIYGNVYISVIGGTVDNLEVGRWRPGYEILVVEDAHAFIGSDATVNQFGSYDGILYYDRATGAWATDGEAVPYIPTGATVTIDSGETITFANGLTNNGTIVNNGTIILDAPLQGNAITGNGTIERRTAYITTSEAVSSLEVYVNGEKTTNYSYEFTEDKVYLWLSEGTITAVLNGTKYSGTYTKTVASELKNFVPVESITIEQTTVNANTKTGLTVKVTPENATYQDVILTVADDSGATITGHSITTVQGGTTELTATVKYGKDGIEDFTSSHTITSSYTAVSNVTLSLTELANGNSKYLDNYCKVEPANASYQDIQWSVVSGSANIYSSTRLEPTRTGTLVVRATIKNGAAYGTDYTIDFNINVPYIAVTGINGTVSETMIINGKVELPTGVTPANASYKNIKWSIVSGADATNASISNGVLTATKTGDITLRATVENGSAEGTSYTKEYNITVYVPESADISNGNIVIIEEDADNNRVTYSGFEGGYKIVPKTETIDITGTLEKSELSELYNITINGTTANINLNNLHIKHSCSSYTDFDGIIDLKNKANVVMSLEGDNSLYSKEPSDAIIHVPDGSTLTIKSENNGSLVAEYGGNGGRGAIIGGADEGTTGTIKIESGTITGTYAGGIYGAIIGSGENGSGGTVEITGGTIHVTAGAGAAIGSGKSATTGTNVIISGGVVNATNNGYGAAIGGGDSAACGDITITGGIITAKCPDASGAYRPGAGIGAGQNASPIGTITISGGTIDAYSQGGYGIGKAAAVNSTVNIVIQGGNIKGSSKYVSAIAGDSITDGNGNVVSLVTLTIDGVNNTPVESVQPSITYGLQDVYTLDTDKLYFYPPANTNITSVTADGDVYTYREATGTYRTTISVDITGISSENAIYDGKQHIGYTGTIISGDYTGNYEIMYTGRNTTEYSSTEAPKNIGDYTVTIAVPAENEDYKGSASIDFSIEEYSANDAVANTTEWTSNAFITAPEGHYISTSNADNGFDSKMTKLMIDTESASASGTVITYYLKNIEKGYITTTPKQITVKVDTHAPSFSEDGAGITITNGNTWWQNLLEFFGFKYYNNKELTFQANDPLSGVSKIYFYIDETDDTTAKTQEELDALDESVWNSVENGQSYTLSGDTHYVVYAYALDNADNRSNYISSDGIIIDTVSPSVDYCVTDITATSAKITLTATDIGSGIASYELINIEGVVSPSSSIKIEEISAGVFAVSNLSPNREYRFGYKVVDHAGNSIQNSGDYISNPITLRTAVDAVVIEDITPIAGEEFDTQLSENDVYTSSVTWNTTDTIAGYNTNYSVTIVLTPKADYRFFSGTTAEDYAVSYHENGTLTLTRTFDATRKANITSVTEPGFDKFESYYTDVEDALDYLNNNVKTISVTVEDGTTSLPITWSFDGTYDSVPNHKNDFTWTIVTEDYNADTGVALSNTKEITNVDPTPVTITGDNTTVTYKGDAIDLSSFFDIDKNAGEAQYYVEPLTGAGKFVSATEYSVTKAGTFKVEVRTAANGKYDVGSKTIQLSVEKGTGSASVTLDDWTYGEAAKTPVIASDTNTTTEYTFVYESTDGKGYYSTTSAPTDAGKYKVTVTLPENDLYKKVVTSDTFEINTRALNITGIKIKDKMYDGNTNAQIESITTDVLDADKDGIIVTVDNPQFSTKDVYDFITVDINEEDIQLAGNRVFNYHLGTLPEKPYYGNIKQRPITIIPDAGQNKVYGDEDPAFTYTVGGDYGLVDGETLKGSLLKEAGERVGFLGYDINDLRTNNRNYSMTLDTTNKFEITKATLTITAESYTVSEGVVLPVFSYKQEGLKLDDQITTTPTYACDATDTSVVGEYAITPSDIQINSGTATNQYTIIYVSGVLTVENNWNPEMDTEYTVNSTEWLNTEFVVTPKEGYVIGANKVDWVTELKGTTEGEENQLSFYVKNIETGAISLQEVVNYKLDKNTETTGTTGKVSFDERNGWETFLNTISFGLFYKDEVTVKVEATDALSGVESIEYYAFESTDGTALTLEQVQAITDWTAMPIDGVGMEVQDEKQFVYYIRITDKAGNVTYLSTDGAEYDTTAPAIDGVKQDTTYYTTQSVKVEDKNLKSVTVNGEEVDDLTKALVLEGNKEATYEIIAIDKAGNKTTVKVTMKKLASQSTEIEDTTLDNVKTDDKQEIEDIKKELEAIDTTNATDAEKEEIKKQIAKCEELLKKIAELEAPKTGDYNNLWMLFALLFVSGMSILGITVSDKKRR